MYKASVSSRHRLNDTSLFRQKSHLLQLNWRGPDSISEVLSGTRVCVFVCCNLIFLVYFSGVMHVWDSSPQQRLNLRHLLCTSSIFSGSWHFTSWTNCQLSKRNFRNDMSKFTPPPQTHTLQFTLPQPLCIYLHAIGIFCTHMLIMVHTRSREDKWSSTLAPPALPLFRPTFSYRLNSLLMVVLYATI